MNASRPPESRLATFFVAAAAFIAAWTTALAAAAVALALAVCTPRTTINCRRAGRRAIGTVRCQYLHWYRPDAVPQGSRSGDQWLK